MVFVIQNDEILLTVGEEKNQPDATSTDVYSQLINSQHVLGIIMPIVRRTEYINIYNARVPAPHDRSQHNQANTTRSFIYSVLLTMGIMMPETC